MTAIKFKRRLRGKDGGIHPHLKDAQDFPPVAKTPELCRQQLRNVARTFLVMMTPWCKGRQAETIARAAVGALIDALDKEKS